uniref:Putative mitochondrial half-size ABC transporter n=1 Tax=Moniliophthora roreri TaxID=221103 RepID=A0A0W0EYS8_MONRR
MSDWLDLVNKIEYYVGTFFSTRYAGVAAITILLYDHIVTFGAEVDLIWTKSWSFIKALFLVPQHRYFGFICVVIEAIAFFGRGINNTAIFVSSYTVGRVAASHRYTVVLLLWIFVMYNGSKRVTGFLGLLFLGEAVSVYVMLGKSFGDIHARSEFIPDVPFCAMQRAPEFMLHYWIPILVYNVAVFLLIAAKGVEILASPRTRVSNAVLIDVYLKSTTNFVAMFSVYLLCCVFWLSADFALAQIPVVLALSLSITNASNLLLHLREAYYLQVGHNREDAPRAKIVYVDPATSNSNEWILLSPAPVLCIAISLFLLRPPPPPAPSPITPIVVAQHVPRRAFILLFLSLASFIYFFDGLTFVIFAVIRKEWPSHSGIEINAVLGLIAFSGLAALGSWKEIRGHDIWSLRRVKFAVALSAAVDIALVVLLALDARQAGSLSTLPIQTLLHLVFPALRLVLLLPLLLVLSNPRVIYSPVESDVDEEAVAPSLVHPQPAQPSTGLLAVPTSEHNKYGTFRSTRSTYSQTVPSTRAPTPTPSHKAEEKPEITLEPTWGEIWRRIKRLSPYLWPKKSRPLQLVALICIFLLLIGRLVNAAQPFALGELVKIFEGRSSYSVWPVLGIYVALRFLQGSGGLAALRDALWAPVMQYSDREMSELSFNHLLNLSFSFHTRRKTGEILRVLDRGAAINRTLELILFSIVPTFIDIAIALVVFCIKFEWTLALIIFVVMFAYVSASVVLTQWRTRIRRQMNERDVITRGIHTDCLLNYETVKYFGGEEHEAARYRDAIQQYQTLEYRVIISLNILNLIQNFIITAGLLVGSIIVARRVTSKQSDPSDFVIFITYLAQLYTPLNQLGYLYRSVNQSLVDTEKLLRLLNEPTDINDLPNAPDLIVQDGEIEFDNVSFSYDGRTTALNGVSFKVPKGSSVALVGESGSGKSTILRLLFRFYDLAEGQGRILIDGKDIREVTQKSLRQAIGVVPQDSVLFNTTIAYNIGYGKFGASQEEVEIAAKSAQMHDRIMSFPDGYETVVGERGVRLSGGEKQRVSIARTLLKNPPILLLDEATSALDTSTEKDIQKALQNLMMGRSSLSIAHRLSTIANADIILVLKDGQIVEQGNHKELLAQDGLFASMWADQVSATEDQAASIHSAKPEVSGYNVVSDDTTTVPTAPTEASGVESVVGPPGDAAASSMSEEVAPPADKVTVKSHEATASEPAPIAFPSSESQEEPRGTAVKPVDPQTEVFEAPTSPTSSPVAFPTADVSFPASPPTPGVTFEETATPPRSGTPDPESEPKRKRISSQNFQRLAKRISISTRRQGSVSSIIPGLKRDSPRVSTDDGRAEGSNDSPSPSVADDSETKGKKKEKKEKKRKS